MSERLSGKVALVTGSGSGIGQGCALRFAAEGVAVVGCDIDEERSAATVRRAEDAGLEMVAARAVDLTDPEAAAATVATRPELRDQVMAKLMLKRLGQPDDIALLATYLAADESSWVTGADFAIDGGATAW